MKTHVLFLTICIMFPVISSAQIYGVGDTLKGGTVFLVDTSERTYTIVHQDSSRNVYTWNDAQNEIEIHNDSTDTEWRLPTSNELKALFLARESGFRLRGEVFWSSEIDRSYHAQQMRTERSQDLTMGSGMDGTFNDIGSHQDEYVKTINFFNGIIGWKKKGESNAYVRVLTVTY